MFNETDQTLLDLGTAFLERLRIEHANAVEHAQRLASTIESVEQTIRTLAGAPVQEQMPFNPPVLQNNVAEITHVIPSVPVRAPSGWARRLRGFTHHEALILIAEDNGGIVRTRDATEILINAGLSKGQSRNVYRSVLNLLSQSDEFERAGKGTYRLVSASQPINEQPAIAPGWMAVEELDA